MSSCRTTSSTAASCAGSPTIHSELVCSIGSMVGGVNGRDGSSIWVLATKSRTDVASSDALAWRTATMRPVRSARSSVATSVAMDFNCSSVPVTLN